MAGRFRLIVGLEIHARVASVSKAFSRASVSFAATPNTKVNQLDMALPGAYPVVNEACVRAGVETALALHMTIAPSLSFDRKHYTYHDLPLGYQITQERNPLGRDGYLDVQLSEDDRRHLSAEEAGLCEQRVRVPRLQLEHDSAKSLHSASDCTLVDLNRCGIGLLEIVTAPDIGSAPIAVRFVKDVISILTALGVCDGNLSEGSLRVDANINVVVDEHNNQRKTKRTEIKNINGLRFLGKAIEVERARHVQILEEGVEDAMVIETRNYDPQTNTTLPMRTKEENLDYRFMPDPDLPPMHLSSDWIAAIASSMPLMPKARIGEIVTTYGIGQAQAELLDSEGGLFLFEGALAASTEGSEREVAATQQMANFITTDVYAHANARKQAPEAVISPMRLAGLMDLVAKNALSLRAAKLVLEEIAVTGEKDADPASIAKRMDLLQISDAAVLHELAERVVETHAKQREKFLAGQTGVLGFFVGEVMKATRGKANPQQAKELVLQELRKRTE